eukprot:GHVS01086005.1.p1 GENE.GHVS01086005.1~~GHVS01086005.1.p1  ORF type:complete len:141 (-),score=15.84 GHVS01086005.1:267-689(-)
MKTTRHTNNNYTKENNINITNHRHIASPNIPMPGAQVGVLCKHMYVLFLLVHTHMCTYNHVRTTCTHMYITHVYTHMYVHVHTCTSRMFTHTCTHNMYTTHVRTCTHMYLTHVYTHMYVHHVRYYVYILYSRCDGGGCKQ